MSLQNNSRKPEFNIKNRHKTGISARFSCEIVQPLWFSCNKISLDYN